MKNKALQIVEHYGIGNQLKKLSEEVFELQEAITIHELKKSVKYEIPHTEIKGSREHIIEELGDVRFMLLQFQSWYGITDEDIEKVMIFKSDRQNERIKNERII